MTPKRNFRKKSKPKPETNQGSTKKRLEPGHCGEDGVQGHRAVPRTETSTGKMPETVRAVRGVPPNGDDSLFVNQKGQGGNKLRMLISSSF